ncbi:phage tail tape measure protein [Peribacillus muralis]|uniref:phage tail tape measure protein n=1 Tax=Peribacillus muralis TaxID=264697 RepID=UPI00381CA137
MAANVGTIKAELLLENRQFMDSMRESMREMGQLRNESSKIKISQGHMKSALMGVGTGVVAAIGASVMTAARFEKSMTKVKAISGATGEDFDKLEQTAKDLGASTAFSATEAADGMGLLAAAGFKTNEIIDSMPGLLNLAGAAQTDLAQSADWLGSIMSGFGIKAEDSAHSVDVLVQAMNDANTDLPDMAEAMKYVAPVASSLKIGLEDTAAAIALMSNYGIKGSQAGTTLRTSLLALANPVGQGKKMMKDLGLSVKDSSGEMLSLPKMIDAISESLQGKSEADRVSAAAALVGTEASSGFLALLNEGGDTIENFSRKLEGSDGAAAAFAATMKDTLVGAWDNLTSSIEGVGIEVGQAFMPEVKKAVDIVQSLVEVISDVNPNLVELALKMAGGASAVGTLYFALTKIPKAFKALQLAMGPTGWIMIGLGAIAGAMMNVNEKSESLSAMSMTQLADAAKTNRSLEEQADRFDQLRGKMKLSSDEWARYIDLKDKLGNSKGTDEIKKVKDEMEKLQKASGLSSEELEELVGINGELAKTVPDSTAVISDQNNVVLTSTDAVRKYTDAKRDELLIELELKKAKAESNERENLAESKRINEEMNSLNKELVALEKDVLETSKEITSEKKKEKAAREANQEGAAQFHDQNIRNLEFELQKYKDQKVKIHEKLLAKQKEGAEVEKELGLLETVDQQMATIILAQVGLNGKKEDGVKLIDDEIIKNTELLAKLGEKAQKEKLSKDEAQDLADQYIGHIDKLNGAKQLLEDHLGIKVKDNKMTKEQKKALDDLKGSLKAQGYALDTNTGKVTKVTKETEKTREAAKKTNIELGKKINKEVKTDDKGSNAKNHKDATKKGEKQISITDKGSNIKNHQEATKKGDKDVSTKDRGSNSRNHSDATKNGTKWISVDDRLSNIRNHARATKAGTKNVTLTSPNYSSWLQNIIKPASKKISIVGEKVGSAWNNLTGKKHSGGTVHELPKYHDGGSPSIDGLFGRMGSAPRFDEVDVRLLRNEMVLTQGQQANLFRMVSSFGQLAENRVKGMDSSTTNGKVVLPPIVVQTNLNGRLIAEETVDVLTEIQSRRALADARARGEY